MTTAHHTPAWLIEQRREMDRRLFDQNLTIANRYRWLAQHGPERERAANARLAEHYVGRALAFAEGGPRG